MNEAASAGRLRGEQVPTVAEILPDSEIGAVERLIAAKYRFDMIIFRPLRFARSLLERTAVDWEKAGYGRAELEELAEFALRVLQSLVLDPGTPRRSGSALRDFLRRWVGPAIARGETGGNESPP